MKVTVYTTVDHWPDTMSFVRSLKGPDTWGIDSKQTYVDKELAHIPECMEV